MSPYQRIICVCVFAVFMLAHVKQLTLTSFINRRETFTAKCSLCSTILCYVAAALALAFTCQANVVTLKVSQNDEASRARRQ